MNIISRNDNRVFPFPSGDDTNDDFAMEFMNYNANEVPAILPRCFFVTSHVHAIEKTKSISNDSCAGKFTPRGCIKGKFRKY